MVFRVEHELHGRRWGRNVGVGLLLIGMVVIVFGLTVVKVRQLGDVRAFEAFDHVARPQLETLGAPAATAAAPTATAATPTATIAAPAATVAPAATAAPAATTVAPAATAAAPTAPAAAPAAPAPEAGQ